MWKPKVIFLILGKGSRREMHTNIEDDVSFSKWLDDEQSFLVIFLYFDKPFWKLKEGGVSFSLL